MKAGCCEAYRIKSIQPVEQSKNFAGKNLVAYINDRSKRITTKQIDARKGFDLPVFPGNGRQPDKQKQPTKTEEITKFIPLSK